ncbi:MAG: hypothetical protein FJ000_00410, partial [Actinobacteria bacterium]|nr:hypothetical protein [Actinomycetota bacterium]
MSMIQLIGIGAATFILILLIIALIVTRRRERARATAAAPPGPIAPARPGAAPPARSVLDGAPRDDLHRLRGEKPGEPEEYPAIISSAASAPSAVQSSAAVEAAHEAAAPDAAVEAHEARAPGAAPEEAHEAAASIATPPSAALWAGAGAAATDAAAEDRDLWSRPVEGGPDTPAEQTGDQASGIAPALDTDTGVPGPAVWMDEEGAELEPVAHGEPVPADDPWSSSPPPDEPSADDRALWASEAERDDGADRRPDAVAEAWPPGLDEVTPHDVEQTPVAGTAEDVIVVGAEEVDAGDSPRSAFASQPFAAETSDTPSPRHDEVVRDDTVIWTPTAGVSAEAAAPTPRDAALETAGPTVTAAAQARAAGEHAPRPAAPATAADEGPTPAAGPDRPAGMPGAAATAAGA